MRLKRRFWGSWLAIALAVFWLVASVVELKRGSATIDDFFDLRQALVLVIFAGFAILLGALAYRSAKRRKLDDTSPRNWQLFLELACLVVPLLLVAAQEDPLLVIQATPVPLVVLLWSTIAYVAAVTGTTQPRAPRMARAILVTLPAAMAAYVLFALYQERQLARTMSSAWPFLGQGISSTPSRFPQRRKTATAIEAERIASAMGVSMQVGDAPQNADGGRFESIRPSLSAYLSGVMIQATRHVGPPPTDVVEFLDLKRNTLDDLCGLVLTGDPIRWEVDVSETRYYTRLPVSLGGHLHIHRLLLSDAFLSLSRGEEDRAVTILRAAMVWADSLREQPDLIARLTYIAESRNILAGVLRVPLSGSQRQWLEARRRDDVRALISEGMAHDNWQTVLLMKQPPRFRVEDGEKRGQLRFDAYGIWRWIARPVMLQSQRHTIEMERAMLEELLGNTHCSVSEDAQVTDTYYRQSQLWLSHGAYVGRTTPNVATAWNRVRYFRLLTELAAVARRGNPQTVGEEIVPSAVCRGMGWRVSGRGDGAVSVRFTPRAVPGRDLAPSQPPTVTGFMTPPLEYFAGLTPPDDGPASQQILKNGGFEIMQDDFPEAASWTNDEVNLVRQSAWTRVAGPAAYAPRDGRWFALLNATGGKEKRLSQVIDIPKQGTTARLTFWLRIDPVGTGSAAWLQDTLEVHVVDSRQDDQPATAILDVISGREGNAYTYQKRSYVFNVAPWRGAQLSLHFVTRAATPGRPDTVFLLDDVSVEAGN